jgi:ubiquinone/menaquinone biosynthesis C-methylase UbiE
MAREITRDDVLRANIDIHTSLIDLYDDQPHFRPENKKKVSAILSELRTALKIPAGGRSKLLDMGCGTGFLLALASDIFDELHGVDITPAMLDKIETSNGKIQLHCGVAEKTPFEDNSFDVVTAYSFMDHLFELRSFLTEVYRVLKPGGIFYSDQNANRSFWEAIGSLDGPLEGYSAIVQREMTVGMRPEDELAKEREVDTDEFRAAEYIKTQQNGIDADEVVELARDIGFSDCRVKYDWFLGQGKVMHSQSFTDAEIVETYLREVAPLSNQLFKYLRFDIRK